MSDAPPPHPDALRLLRCLLDGNPTAPADLAAAYLEPLAAGLSTANPRVDPQLCEEAAEEALCALYRNPHSYRPEEGLTLEAFLRMSARGDLRNLLHKENKHQRGRRPWKVVEHSADGGNYLRRDDDPSLPLQIAEAARAAAVPDAVRAGLTETDLRVLELMLAKERSTAVYARAMELPPLPPEEERREVKRVKDRLQKRLDRARSSHEQSP